MSWSIDTGTVCILDSMNEYTKRRVLSSNPTFFFIFLQLRVLIILRLGSEYTILELINAQGNLLSSRYRIQDT